MENILKLHGEKYPKMTTQDFVKLIYQNEFGCGHFIADKNKSLERIKSEIINSAYEKTFLENIGNGFTRLWLGKSTEDFISAELINKMFILSSEKTGDINSFKNKLSVFYDLIKTERLNLSINEAETYLKEYQNKSFPMVSHSDIFHKFYNPTYRVIENSFSVYFELISKIEKMLSEKEKITVEIDGRCTSGKSTLAKLLQSLFGGEIISADDFFLPFEKRTAERMRECGGTLDYERFKTEVIDKLSLNKAFDYGVFSCKSGKIEGRKTIARTNLIIVEGSYSGHEYFGNPYDIRVFLTSDRITQEKRILERNGSEMLKNFAEKWIPMEEKYFDGQKIREKSDFIIHTDIF